MSVETGNLNKSQEGEGHSSHPAAAPGPRARLGPEHRKIGGCRPGQG